MVLVSSPAPEFCTRCCQDRAVWLRQEKKSLAVVKVKKFDYGLVILDLSLMELIRFLLSSWVGSSLYIPCQISEFSQTMMARRLMQELDVIHPLIAVSQSCTVLILLLSNGLVEKYSFITSVVRNVT